MGAYVLNIECPANHGIQPQMETKVVLEGITVGGKFLRKHFEAINHRDAILYVEDVVRREEPLSEWQIRNPHRLVLKQIDDDNAGSYRKLNVTIAGARHVPPDMLQVPKQMAAMLRWYDHEAMSLHPVDAGRTAAFGLRENSSFCRWQWPNCAAAAESGTTEVWLSGNCVAGRASLGLLPGILMRLFYQTGASPDLCNKAHAIRNQHETHHSFMT